ncbi:MAG: hypothetical protein KDA64_19010 [Rhodospirillaceae bacterium]|nr:hypothetical protein [Rhodospirillaceae bacterium]
MPDAPLRHPLDHLTAWPADAPDVVLRSLADATCAYLLARKGQADALAAALGIAAQVGTVSRTGPLAYWCVAPGRWWVVAETGRSAGIADQVAGKLGDTGYVSDQSQARAMIRVTGPRVLDVLAKGCSLDLAGFGAAACAQTQIAHISAAIAATDGGFDLLVPSGFAQDFWEWLEASAAEFAPQVVPA